MGLARKEYVSMQGIGNVQECTDLRHRIHLRLGQDEREGTIRGWHARALLSRDDVQDEDLDDLALREITGGTLPAVQITITFEGEAVPLDYFTQLEEEFDLRL